MRRADPAADIPGVTQGLLSWLLPLLLALMPAAVKWLLDRRLARRIDDPALPERLMAQGPQAVAAFGLAIGLAIVFWPARVPWMLLVMVPTIVAAGFPLRRRLLGETWGLAAYLWFMARLLLATQGIWIALLLAPALTNHRGWAGWVSAAILSGLLLAWSERFGDVVRWVMRAIPLADQDLLARITQLVDRTDLLMPRLDVVPMNGGVFANAAALPSLQRSGVLFSETLLTRLRPDEVTAITAHELAHLEQFHPRRLQWLRVSTAALIVMVVCLAPALRAVGLPMTFRWHAGVMALVFGYLGVVGYKRQQYETASDLRALELTGDPEPLVSALVKLHLLTRVPRRWDQSVEPYASHPSLARRVKAIRDAAAAESVALVDEPEFAAADGSGRSVRFERARIVWQDRSGSVHALPYQRLSALRVKPGRGESAGLEATDDEGREWSLPLQPTDLGRVQAVLDVVDVRVSYGSAPAANPVTTLVASLAGLVAFASGQFIAALLLQLPMFDRSSPTIAAAGAASLAAALLVVRDGAASRLLPGWGTSAVLFLAALFLLSVAWRLRHAAPTARARRVMVAMGVLLTGSLLPLAMLSTEAVAFHHATQAWPAFTNIASALAAALFLTRARWARSIGAVAAVAAAATLAAGSTPFLEHVITDPLLVDAPAVREVTLDAEPVGRIEIAADADGLLLSPGGDYIAAIEGVGGHLRRFHITKPGGDVRVVTAEWAAFVDDRTLITSDQLGDDVIVSRFDLESPLSSPLEHRVRGVTHTNLSASVSAGGWRILGHDQAGGVLSIEGSAAEGEVTRARWAPEVVRGLHPVAVDGRSLIGIESHYAAIAEHNYWLWPLLFSASPGYGLPRQEARLWRLSGDRREALVASALSPDCGEVSRVLTCAAYDGSRTHVVRVAMDTGVATGLGRFAGRLLATERQPGWLGGFLMSGDAVAMHVDTATLLRVPDVDDEFTSVMAGAADRVATLSNTDDASIVRLYELPWAAGASKAAASRP